MTEAMNWVKLLSTARQTEQGFQRETPPAGALIHPHQMDTDRVLFSSAFRRLQAKTQVYMFPQTDYVRNRLTHSLEVESIGRLLSTGILRKLTTKGSGSHFKEQAPENVEKKDILQIVAAACISHDIGNPPFGHIGEYAIRSWFTDIKNHTNRPELERMMNPSSSDTWKDFAYFDGNAQGFRILTKLQGWGERKGGLRLTAATLGACAKYPNGSEDMPKPGKFGYYQSEKPTFRSLANEIGLIEKEDGVFTKHPLAFIAEAADDIAYLTSDIEDAHKFGMISYDKAYDILIKAARTIGSFQENLLGTISEEENKIKFLRSAASIAMIKSCSEVFVAHEIALLEGNVSKSLIELSDDLAATEIEMRNVCNEYIYFHPKKVKSEAGAYEIIGNLLSVFSEAIEESLSKNGKDLSARSKNLLKMFDPDEKTQKTTNSYDSYLRLVDYISGMTDRYALDVHETLSGRKLSNGF